VSCRLIRKIFLPSLIFTASLAFLTVPLLRNPLLTGIDGPYYAVQVRWLLEYNKLKYPDPPLAFILMTLMTILVGDVFLGIKLTVVIFTSLASIPWYFLYERKNKIVAGLAGGLTFLINWFSPRLASDFMKNSIGLLWFSLYILFCIFYLEYERKRDLALASISLLLTALTHILDLGVAFFYSLSLPFLYILFTKRIEMKTVIILLQGVAIVIAGLLMPSFVGGDIYKGLVFVEELIEEDNLVILQIQNFLLSLGMAITLFLASFFTYRKEKTMAIFFLATGVLAVLLNLPLIPRKWLFRFRLMSIIPFSCSIGSALYIIEKEHKTLPVLLLILALISSPSLASYRMVKSTITVPEYNELRKVVALFEEKGYAIVIPDVRIRYWAETFSDNIYRTPKELEQTEFIFLTRINVKRLPFVGHVIWKGKFFIVYMPKK